MRHLISIIIPLRSGDDVLEDCIESINTQTYKNKEIIIKQSDGNANVNRNLGAKEAKGNFLFFCDADIVLKPDCLEKMYNVLMSDLTASYAYCNYQRAGYLMGVQKGKPFNADVLRRMNYISTMSLIRTKHFLGFDEEIERLQDWELWLRMLDQNYTGTFIDEILFIAMYKKYDVSTSSAVHWQQSVDAIHKKRKTIGIL